MRNKSLRALLRGYIRFDVNGNRFWLYNSALAHRNSLRSIGIGSTFIGFNIIKGRRVFSYG